MTEYSRRLNDPLCPVYEVDRTARTWLLYGSRIGTMDVGGTIPAGKESRFDTAEFQRVYLKPGTDGTFTATPPAP